MNPEPWGVECIILPSLICVQMAKHLVAKGARVIIAGRSQARVSEAVASLGPNALGEIVDLASFRSSERGVGTILCVAAHGLAWPSLSQSRSLQLALELPTRVLTHS